MKKEFEKKGRKEKRIQSRGTCRKIKAVSVALKKIEGEKKGKGHVSGPPFRDNHLVLEHNDGCAR